MANKIMTTPIPFEQEFPQEAAWWQQALRFNTRPRPGHQYQILGERNEPCGCGSGQKTKRCCGPVPLVRGERSQRSTFRVLLLDGVEATQEACRAVQERIRRILS